MEMRAFCGIPIETDEPVAAILQFIHILRENAVPMPKSRIDVTLVGTSARAEALIKKFNPDSITKAPFDQALKVVEELAAVPAGKIKSLNILIAAEDFHWKGATASTSAKLVLMDMKVFQRKQRFDLTATMDFEAPSLTSDEVTELLAEVKKETRLEFTIEAGSVE